MDLEDCQISKASLFFSFSDAAEAKMRQSLRKSKSQRDNTQTQLPSQSDQRQTSSGAHNDDLPDPILNEPFPSDPFPYTKEIPKDDVVERSFQDKLSLMGRGK